MAIAIEEHKLARFLQGIRLGMKIKHAAAYGDFNPKTFYEWKKKALGLWPDGGDWPEEVAFYRRYLATDAEKVAGLLADVLKGAKTDWRAAMRLLELSGYTVKQEHEHTGPAGVALPITFNLSGLSPDELAEAKARLKAAKSGLPIRLLQLSIPALREALATGDYDEHLAGLREAEEAGRNGAKRCRVGALDALDKRAALGR